MTTKLKNYRINITDDAQPGDALVVGENDGFVTWHMGTSASCDIGTSCGNIPVLDENGKIPSASIPSAVMKKDTYDPNNKNADAFDYCNLDNTPEIPEVFDPVITFTQGGVTKGSISLNQSSPTVIPLDAGGVTSGDAIDIYNSKVSVKYDGTSIGKNTSNQICVVDYDTIKQGATCGASAIQADDLATVAMTGNYCDLINKPEIPSAQIQSNWSQTNTNLPDYIKNKPTIGNATITLQKNGSNVDTFELNQTADKCINLVLSKGDVGLTNVDNTSDADKPVSDATLCALACKQDNITDLNTIRSNACAGKTASETIANYGNIVTHNVCEFATVTQGGKADTAVQPGDLCTVATTGAYSDLTGTPALCPIAISGSYTDLINTPALCNVATSGKYCDLTGSPLLCNVATTAQYSDLLGVPNLCTVATSGKYCDLSGIPTIPTVINTLTSSCTTEALSAKQGCVLNTSITNINGKIPSAATTSNQLADKAFVNSSINAVAAYYITKDAQGDQFATKAELDDATVYYSGGEVRTPTRNDYTIVASDETHDDATTRYSYNNGWEYQYTINETPLTQAQLNALNSGITSSKVSDYDSAVNIVNNLSTVATSGKYCDLSGAPTLCTVATSGKYCDLSGLPTIPTNNNQLVNGCGYTTCTGTVVASDLTSYAKSCTLCTVATSGKYCDLTGLPTIPTNNNQLTNGCGYTTCTGTLVAGDLAPYAKSCTLCSVSTSGQYCDLSGAPSLATVATTGCYNDLTGKPTIPTKVSQLTNDCNYIDNTVNNLTNYTPTASLSTVATSGAYCDLSGKPTLACVACSGSYEDLTCKPNLGVYQTTANMVCTLANADDSHYPSVKTVADALSCAGAGDMLSSMYDPNGKCADAFDYTNFINTPLLCTVATSGKYCDLTGLPTIPAALTSGCAISISSNKINVNYDGTTIKKNSGNCLYADFSGLATTSDLATKADDSCVVHLDGAETISGVKTFGTTNTWEFDGTNATLYSPSSNGYLYVTRGSGASAVTMAIKSGSSGGTFGTTTDDQFQFRTNDKMRMQVDSEANGGKIKLATTSIPATGDNSAYVPSTSWVQGELGSYAKSCILCTVATSGKYCDLTGKPTIPTDNCQLANSCGYITDSAVNTKTFTLSSTLDTTNASAAAAYINDGDDAIILYNGQIYILSSKTSTQMVFKGQPSTTAGTSSTSISQSTLTFTVSGSTVTSISSSSTSLGSYLETGRTYSTAFTPTNAGHPATKKYVDDSLSGYAQTSSLCTVATSGKYCDLSDKPTIPTDNCQLANSCGYTTCTGTITSADLATYAKCTDIPTNNNQLTNGCGYTTCTGTLVASDLNPYAKSCMLCTVATSGKYCDLTGQPTLCSVATTGCYNDLTGKPSLCTVATSGKYCDLSGAPSLCTVATSGKYCDLTGQPAIPTVGNATITLTQEGNSIGCFTTNSSTASTIDLEYGICYVCCECASCYSSCCDNRTYLIYE